jgi:glycogen operon protein
VLGLPWPPGATLRDGGLNLAVWAPEADRIELCLFDETGQTERERRTLPACTDGVWHGWWPDLGAGLIYGLRAYGPWNPARGQRFNPTKLLLDPWAQEVVGRYEGDLSLFDGADARDNAAVALKARVPAPVATPMPRRAAPLARSRRVIQEVHVRAATMRHPQVPEALRGSYAGLAHAALIEHWQRLGVTTLNLMPIQARADEARLQGLGLRNHWGYSTIGYLAPEPRYWSGRTGTSARSECREMIRRLKDAGFEVVLDVVFNHTAETDETGPSLSFRGLADRHWYRHSERPEPGYVNWSGCGNVLNLAEPRVVQFVIGALRHWVEFYGVDGFRFDLAPILARDAAGHFSRGSAFLAALQADPVLSQVLWIAEPWDLGPGGYQLGHFPAGWLEWNDRFRDTMRAFWLTGGVDRAEFVHRWAASSTEFRHDSRSPLASVNFITAHDGFTLHDLLSYSHRHNQANGEHNRDGHAHNLSWNGGVEGPSDDAALLALRQQLRRALLACLLLAQGTPMLLMGDELGHSQQGNNNAYCQDNTLTWLDWSGGDDDLRQTVTRLLALRQSEPVLRQERWLDAEHVAWLQADGRPIEGEAWHERHQPGARALMVRLGAVLVLINAAATPLSLSLPSGTWMLCFASHRPGGSPDTVQEPIPDLPARAVLVFRLEEPR